MVNLTDIENVMKLMTQYECDEFANPDFTIKKSKHKPSKQELTDQELLQKHLKSINDEPWMDISDKQLEEFSVKGRV